MCAVTQPALCVAAGLHLGAAIRASSAYLGSVQQQVPQPVGPTSAVPGSSVCRAYAAAWVRPTAGAAAAARPTPACWAGTAFPKVRRQLMYFHLKPLPCTSSCLGEQCGLQ
jgi:hypothetical protein